MVTYLREAMYTNTNSNEDSVFVYSNEVTLMSNSNEDSLEQTCTSEAI